MPVKPSIITRTLPDGSDNNYYEFQLEANSDTPVRWYITGSEKIQKGLELSEEGILSGIPIQTGVKRIIIACENEYDTATRSFTLLIDPVLPSIITESIPNGLDGIYYSKKMEASGTEPLSWFCFKGLSSNEEGLCTGLALSEIGNITGTPILPGDYSFIIEVSNVKGSDQKEYSLSVSSVAPTIITESLEIGENGSFYNCYLESEGTNNYLLDSISWSIIDGILPPGLELIDSPIGRIVGLPYSPGTYEFTVKAQNSVGYATKNYSITIKSFPPKITKLTLDEGRVTENYIQVISSNGTKPIKYSISQGSLPNGFYLTDKGSIYGKTNNAGVYNFNIRADNSDGYDIKSYELIIN